MGIFPEDKSVRQQSAVVFFSFSLFLSMNVDRC